MLLRVKRLRSDVPVESFETERLNKMSKLDTEASCISTFRYIGSQLSEYDVEKANFENLDKLDPQGSFKLLWNANSGKIFGKGVSSVPCAVRIQNLKRPLPIPDQASVPHPNPTIPVKMMRIIDITPDRIDNGLTDSFHTAASLEPSEASTNEIDYVYDLYRLEKRQTARPSGRSTSACRSPSPLARFRQDSATGSLYSRDEIVFDEWPDDDTDDPDYRVHLDDEDDSNSESNWRNDYPDEEDVVTSTSAESRSSSSELSDSDEGQSHYARYRHQRF